MKTRNYTIAFFFGLLFISNASHAQIVDADAEPYLPSPCFDAEDLTFAPLLGADYCMYQFLPGVIGAGGYWADGVHPLRIEWSFGDGNSTTTDPSSAPLHSYDGPGTYEVCMTYWTSNGVECCKTTICDSVTVPEFYCNPCDYMDDITISITGTNPFNFSAEGLSPDLLEKFGYYWDFGDGFTIGGNNRYHNYAADGHYALRLTIFYFDEATGTCCSREIIQRVIVNSGLIKMDGPPNDTQSKLEVEADDLLVYPNPSDGHFMVNATPNKSINDIAVYNATGQLVYQMDSGKELSAEVLDLAHLEKGVYILFVNQHTEFQQSTRLIID